MAVFAEGSKTVRGRFKTGGTLLMPKRKPIQMTGDDPTKLVLNDVRLDGADFEALGEFAASGEFKIDPIHLRSMWVYKDNQRLMVSYWCDICYIRTYSPGICWCCQEYTKLDLKDPNTKDPTP